MCVCMYVCVYMCVYVCVHVCVYVCVCVYMYIHMYLYNLAVFITRLWKNYPARLADWTQKFRRTESSSYPILYYMFQYIIHTDLLGQDICQWCSTGQD